MTDYQIQPSTRRCAGTGRELRPGERCYSVLLEEGGRLVRQDYSPEAWVGAPAGAFSFWVGKVPTPEQGNKPRFDDEMLLDCFVRMQAQPDPARAGFVYVLALLLMRRKRLRFEQSRRAGDGEQIQLRCVRTGTTYEIVNPRLDDEALTAVQVEVFQLLGWE